MRPIVMFLAAFAAFPAFGQTVINVPSPPTVVYDPLATYTFHPNAVIATITPPATNQADKDKALVEALVAETEAKRAQTALLGQTTDAERAATTVPPYNRKQVDSRENAFLGGNTIFSTQVNDCIAIATSKARKAKLEVTGDILVRCRAEAVKQTDADTRRMVALKALELDREAFGSGDTMAVGTKTAPIAARFQNGDGLNNWDSAFFGSSVTETYAIQNALTPGVVAPPSAPPPAAPTKPAPQTREDAVSAEVDL